MFEHGHYTADDHKAGRHARRARLACPLCERETLARIIADQELAEQIAADFNGTTVGNGSFVRI